MLTLCAIESEPELGETLMDGYNVAVVGATGAVGEAMMEILEEREFPVNEVFPLASERSAGSRVQFEGKSLVVQDLSTFDFSKAQIGLFSAILAKDW